MSEHTIWYCVRTMASDASQYDSAPVKYGQFPPSFRREHVLAETPWMDSHRTDFDIGNTPQQDSTHHIAIIEQTRGRETSDRQVIVRITQVHQEQRSAHQKQKYIEMPLGDFLQQDYWHSDGLGGRLTLLTSEPIDFGAAVRAHIKKDKGTFPFDWIRDDDLLSTYQKAEQHFRGNVLDNRVVDIPLSPTRRLYIHTHVCRPTRIDRASENPYIRQGYRAITVNITEVINPNDPPERHVYKRIHISDKEKLLPMEFPISEWEMHADGFRDAIQSKIPRLPESDVDTIFAHLESNIAVLRTM